MRLILARHAETVFNASARMQGNTAHTPLSRAGIAQAEAMGSALAAHLVDGDAIHIWAAPTGRALQTVAIIAEHLGRDFFDVRTDARLREIEVGRWEGRAYADIVSEQGEIMCLDRRVFTARPPGGEWYPAVADRLRGWLADLSQDRDALVVSHGLTLPVLRGLLAGGEAFESVILADEVPQGTIVQIENGTQTRLHIGESVHRLRSV